MAAEKIKLAEKEYCTGCGACKEVCPKKAIQFINDSEGFPAPKIDPESCVKCGLCTKVCPAINKPDMHMIQECYAVQAKDQEILRQSTSGGVFSIFADAAFQNGGVVYGCVWDEDYNAVFRRAENNEQLIPMHGSKYVWSSAGEIFASVKKDLNDGRSVLFAGLPCQVAGLINYLGRGYDNLVTLDFFCSGTPSPLVFKEWLKTICKDGKLSDLNLKFRDKHPFGVGVNITYSGSGKARKKGQHISNPYYYSFYSRLTDRLSCYHCPYGSDMRVSDLTMGDYWGVYNYHPNMKIRDGVSALLINTTRGRQLFESVKENIFAEPTKKENIAKENNLSIGELRPYYQPPNREAFIQTVLTSGWKKAEFRFLLNARRLKLWLKAVLPVKYISFVKKVLGRK